MAIENNLEVEEICEWFKISKEQRSSEIAEGNSPRYTNAYENQGCYECGGNNKKCPSYLVLN